MNKRYGLLLGWAVLTVVIVLLGACAGTQRVDLLDANIAAPSLASLSQQLESELIRLGVDPARTTAAFPTVEGSQPFDLEAMLVDPDGKGGDPPTGVQLSWTERLVGDYNQDGLVNISDLTPLSQYWQNSITYDSADLHAGIRYWPSGDPDTGGSLNWRKARVDGNADGLVNISDITPIAQHWQERLDGYYVYTRTGTSEFTVLSDPEQPGDPLLVGRPEMVATPNLPVRYVVTIDGAFVEGEEIALTGSILEDTAALRSSGSCRGGGGDDPPLNEPPVAVLTAVPEAGDPPLEVTLDASASSDADGTIVEYAWDWEGDGIFDYTSQTETQAVYTYALAGVYTPALLVTDSEGATSTVSASVVVYGDMAVFSATPRFGRAPLHVLFDASASHSAGGAIVQYEWDFGEGGGWEDYGTVPTAEHDYTNAGTFTASLRVHDDAGLIDVASLKIYALDASAPAGIYVYTTFYRDQWQDAGSTCVRLYFGDPSMGGVAIGEKILPSADGQEQLAVFDRIDPGTNYYVLVTHAATHMVAEGWVGNEIMSGVLICGPGVVDESGFGGPVWVEGHQFEDPPVPF